MPTYGVTDEGFALKRLADILGDLNAALATVEDPVTGERLTPDLLDEDDPLVQVSNAFGDALATAWEELQLAYNQFDPLRATGAGLSGLVQLNGISRRAGTPSTVSLLLTGTPNLLLPAGLRVSDSANAAVFTIPGAVLLDGSGVGAADAECEVLGPVPAGVGTLTKILTPKAGWQGVTNPGAATPGTLEETDAELRARQQLSTASPSQSLVEALYAGLIGVAGVTFARVYQNVTNETDERGIPPHTVAPVVVGGEDLLLAEQLFLRVPVGVDTQGTTFLEVIDVQGLVYPVRFSRPAAVLVYVDVYLTVVDATVWPSDGAAQVEAALVGFAANGMAAMGRLGYQPGSDVYASDLYLPILTIPGTRILAVYVGLTTDPTDEVVSVAWNEIAAFATGRIRVVVDGEGGSS